MDYSAVDDVCKRYM